MCTLPVKFFIVIIIIIIIISSSSSSSSGSTTTAESGSLASNMDKVFSSVWHHKTKQSHHLPNEVPSDSNNVRSPQIYSYSDSGHPELGFLLTIRQSWIDSCWWWLVFRIFLRKVDTRSWNTMNIHHPSIMGQIINIAIHPYLVTKHKCVLQK